MSRDLQVDGMRKCCHGEALHVVGVCMRSCCVRMACRLEHGYTHGSQVRDPYLYPWDTHYPNTNTGLNMGTDLQMRVAV